MTVLGAGQSRATNPPDEVLGEVEGAFLDEADELVVAQRAPLRVGTADHPGHSPR